MCMYMNIAHSPVNFQKPNSNTSNLKLFKTFYFVWVCFSLDTLIGPEDQDFTEVNNIQSYVFIKLINKLMKV